MNLTIHLDIHVYHHYEHHTKQRPATTTGSEAPQLLSTLYRQVERIREAKSPSTRSNYLTAIRSLAAYLQHDVPLSQTEASLFKGYERWLKQRHVGLNTISCYMRSLRSLLHGTSNGNMPIDVKQLFSQVFTGKERTRKRSVTPVAITRLLRLELPPNSFLSLARDVFLFSFYAMGMPFVDVAHLRHAEVGPDSIVYRRQKTGQRVVVALEPALTSIISRYKGCSEHYVFPLLSTGSPHEYEMLIGRYNRTLHRLQHMAAIDIPLTSYVARHTWATTAYNANVDLPVISKALGHANPQTTLTYIREISDQRLATANRDIIRTVADGLGL